MKLDRVLVLSPHTDDAELGAGGTLARFVEEGKEIIYVVFSDCANSIPEKLPRDTTRKECMASTRIIGIPSNNIHILDYEVRTFPRHRQEILEDLVKIRQQHKPDMVLVPSSNDTHQDHQTIYWEALRAFKKEATIWGYEHPWNNLTFTTDIFVKLKKVNLETKIKALSQYHSQADRSYFNSRTLRALVYTRGAQIGVPFAEAFELVRLLF